MKTESLKVLKLSCKILLVTICVYSIAFFLGIAPPLYLFYALETKLLESKFDQRATEIIAELPVYPEAEQIYIYREDTQIFPWLFWGEGIYAPSYAVFYGLKEKIPSEEFDVYMRTALSDAGWPWVYVEWLDGYNFNKEGVCIPDMTFGTSDKHELAEYYAGKEVISQYLMIYSFRIEINLDAVIWMPTKPDWYRPVCSDSVWRN